MKNLTLLNLLILLIYLFPQSGKGQNQLLGQYQNTQTYILNQTYAKLTGDGNTQRYFQALGGYMGQPNPELICTIQMKARLIGEFAGQYRIQVYMGASMSGDTMYRGVGFGETLLPGFVSYDLMIANANSQVLRKFDYRLQKTEWGDVQLNTEYHDTLSFVNCSPSIANLKLHYSQQEVANLQNRVNYINNYWNTDFTPYNHRLQILSTTEVDSFEAYRSFITDCQNMEQRTNNERYIQELGLNRNDPAHFIQKFTDFKTILYQKKAEVDAAMGKFRDLYYEKGMSLMNKDLGKAEGYFRKAVGNTFNNHHMAYMQLARINLLRGHPDSAANKLGVLFPRIQDDMQRTACKVAGKEVFDKYIDMANSTLLSNQYKTALETNSKARDLCNELSLNGCVSACNQIQAKAWNGTYQNQLEKAESAFVKKDFDAAEEYAEDADRTQRNNATEIASDGKPQTILLKVYKERYRYFIEQGSMQLKTNNFQKALDWFDNAYALEGKNVTVNPGLPGMRQKAAKPLFVVSIDSISNMVAADINQARHSFDRLQERITWYQLTNDDDLTKQLDKLKAKIFTQECTNADNAFNQSLGRGRQLIVELKYLEADVVLTNAISTLAQLPRCGLKADRAVKEQQDIAAAAKYQRRLAQSNQLVNEAKFENATSEYKDNVLFFKENNLGAKKLVAVEYPEWALASGNSRFCFYACEQLRGEGNPQTAWRLLGKAMDLGYRPKDTKTLQTLLGTALANQRHNYYSSDGQTRIGPKVDVLNYTNDNKRWKVFKSAFLKQAKVLGWK
ncbi:MAG: hypothetical protein EXR21_07850 [Flavobacteriaceae bacterium]|nr:hypothetical protein [Flavobacteriaceae bacterium]